MAAAATAAAIAAAEAAWTSLHPHQKDRPPKTPNQP